VFFWLGLGIPAACWVSWKVVLGDLRGPVTSDKTMSSMMLAFFSIPLVAIALPFILALPSALVFYGLHAIATIFRNELAALTRADEGATVLGRLRLGLGSKKGG
jgi:hypothetical protein